MLQLNKQIFQRAAQKAVRVQPLIEKHGAQYHVMRSDGGSAIVRFVARNNTIWCECSCPAGSPLSRQLPIPCYHVAAALLTNRANLIAAVRSAWHRVRPFASLETALFEQFGTRDLTALSNDDLRNVLIALDW